MTEYIAELDLSLLTKVGIYTIHHKSKPERLYVGSTTKYKSDRPSHTGFYKRFYDHYRSLRLNKHHSRFLQNTINKYGLKDVVFRIIEICEDSSIMEIRDREQYYIDILKPEYNSFNTVNPQGRIWTDAEKLKQSEKLKGQALPESVYISLRTPIYQYTLKNELIMCYTSIREAQSVTGIDRGSIGNCAASKRKTAGGYVWKYDKLHPNEAKELGFSESRLSKDEQ